MKFRTTKRGVMVYRDDGKILLGPFRTEEDAVVAGVRHDYFYGRFGERMRVSGDDTMHKFLESNGEFPAGGTNGD